MVAIVILNFNGKKHLETYLPSVIKYSKNYRIIVADNASTDDSVLFLQTNYPEIELLQNEKNEGFAGGYNEALKKVNADYFLLLNSDVEVTQNWLEPLHSFMEHNPECAALQPKILDYKDKKRFEYAGAAGGFIDWLGYPFCRGRIFDDCEIDNNQYNDTHEIFWATGACMMVRASVFKELGGFDADFFAHMEEIDLCWRMKNAGHQLYYVGESTVFHLGGGTLNKENPRKTFLNYRNSLAMLYKNLPMKHVPLNIFIRLVLDGVSSIRFLMKGQFSSIFAIIQAHFAFYGMIPTLHKKRGTTFMPISHIYPHSIIWEYFFKKNRTFSSLKNVIDVENWHNGRNWFR